MSLTSSRARRAFIAAALLCGAAPAFAQNAYPSHPVKLIVPYAAGSAGDVIGRVLAAQLGDQLGQAMVIDNRGGAGGTIGTADMAHAAPDGYTLGLGASGTLINNQVLYTKPGYDSGKDFTPIGLVAEVQNVLVVAPGAKYNGVGELLADIRAKPAESFKYSSSGVGTSHHMAGAVLA
ncbi:MAG TPA: tripartite tricarboxylate transporter substrate-binding protein, partial [Burkholderiales bacterium]